jgi:hypothetical protein
VAIVALAVGENSLRYAVLLVRAVVQNSMTRERPG